MITRKEKKWPFRNEGNIMNDNKLFVHKRNVGDIEGDYPIYFDCGGVLKRGILNLFNRMINSRGESSDDYWYCVDDLPLQIQERVQDFVITYGEYVASKKVKTPKNVVYDMDKVLVAVTDTTPILPIVGNLLPSDGVPAYTVGYDKNGSLRLNSILVCWGCHWSDLFTGSTRYKNNVFCLASDLSSEQVKSFVDDIIVLGEAPEYLRSLEDDPENCPVFGKSEDKGRTIKPIE